MRAFFRGATVLLLVHRWVRRYVVVCVTLFLPRAKIVVAIVSDVCNRIILVKKIVIASKANVGDLSSRKKGKMRKPATPPKHHLRFIGARSPLQHANQQEFPLSGLLSMSSGG